MKKILNLLLALPVIAILGTSCQSDDVTYSGKEYVMFSDSTYQMPVLEKDTVFSVPVTATTTVDYDRHYSVEIINEKSTAIRGHHFDFVENSNNVTIKAGERVGNVRIKGNYDNVGRKDSIVLSLRIIEPEEQKWDLYGNVSRIDFVKCPSFSMDKFRVDDGGNLLMYASFPFGDQLKTYLVKNTKVDNHTIMLTDMFGTANAGPLRVLFDDSNPLDLLIRVPEQPAFRESNYGTVWARSVDQYPSYFNTFDNFFVLYLEIYAPQVGSFGVYQYVFRCISKEEAKDVENGMSPFNTRTTISTFKMNKF